MEKYDIKYVAFDMDGTILNSNHEIMPKTKEAIKILMENGIKVIIATGRPVKSAMPYVEELEIAKYGGYLISNNGALATNLKDNSTVFEEYISVEKSKHILEVIKNYKIYPFIRDDKYMYVNDVFDCMVETGTELGTINANKFHSRIGKFLLHEVRDLVEIVDEPLLKVIASGDAKYIEQNIDRLNEELGEDIIVMETLPFVLEFARNDVSKGFALERLGVDLSKTMTFGDSMNDAHMIELAKYGIAMGNAMEKVKAIAYDITDDNNSEGVYKALEKYGLI